MRGLPVARHAGSLGRYLDSRRGHGQPSDQAARRSRRPDVRGRGINPAILSWARCQGTRIKSWRNRIMRVTDTRAASGHIQNVKLAGSFFAQALPNCVAPQCKLRAFSQTITARLAAAAERVWKPSVRNNDDRWTLTVPSPSPSSFAISLFELPFTTSVRTSFCLGVRVAATSDSAMAISSAEPAMLGLAIEGGT